MVHILAAGSLTIDFVRFFTDLNTAEEKYHANLHENAESNNPEPSSGVVTSMCCCIRVHTVLTGKSPAYSCAIYINSLSNGRSIGCALVLVLVLLTLMLSKT